MTEQTSQPLTEGQLTEIAARAAAATPGPWGVYTFGGDSLIEIAADLEDTGCGYRARRTIARFEDEPLDNDPTHSEWTAEEDWAQVQADAEFTAHARENVPALLAEIARLTAQRKYLIGQLAQRDAESGRGDEAVRKFLAGEQPDEQPAVTITAETAAHVLFLECLGGWPPSTFGTKLLNLWTSADSGNAERLAVSFPEYGAALALLRSGTAGIEQLRAIAGA